ncbi:MAE_28990/MAE_18760-like HEPN [Fimbriimonadaceae bacterium]
MTSDELLASLEQDIEWRDGELLELRRKLTSDESPLARGSRRAMVPMVQSHAEGFVRFALRAYLRYISAQGPSCRNVREVHVAWMLTKEFNRIRVTSVDSGFELTGIDDDNKRAKQHYSETKLLETLGPLLDQQLVLDDSPLDQFDQNLNKPYLLAILYHCGLDPVPHSSYGSKLNGLVIRRNQIAHGESTSASIEEIDGWLITLRTLFQSLRDEVFRHAASSMYLK